MMKKNNKKCYVKPQIKQVNLTPQEAVLAGCKSLITPSGKLVGANSCGTKDNFCLTQIIS